MEAVRALCVCVCVQVCVCVCVTLRLSGVVLASQAAAFLHGSCLFLHCQCTT